MFLVLWLMLLALHVAQATPSDPAQVKIIFQTACTKCHGGASPIKFDALNVPEMVEKNLLQGLQESVLYKKLADDSMPQGGPPLSVGDKEIILEWLADGYPPFDAAKPPEELLGYADEVTCIAKDLTSVPIHEAEDYRYLTFTRYYNEGGATHLARAIEAATKLLNSTNMFRQRIELMTAVECNGVPNAIYRLNLEDFNFQPSDWDNFVVAGKYPYFVNFFDKQEFEFFELLVFQKTGCIKGGTCKTIPFVRADWFVARVSGAPLYYDALFKGVDISNVHALEKLLGVDTFEQLFKTYEARRAIFRRSGVTNYNRAVDHYELDFSTKSAYWKTFDVLGDLAGDKKNLFAFPFGPLYSWYTGFLESLKDKVFAYDATEIIWQNENGSLGFFLADGKEKRINEALTEVAYHKTNVHPYVGSKPGAILTGTSCFACHSAMNIFKDEGLSYILASPDFSNAQVDAAKLLFYKDQLEITNHTDDTNGAYAVAAKAMNQSEIHPTDAREPIFATTRKYLNDIGVCEFGAELGFSCEDIKVRLAHAPGLAALIGFGDIENGKASRLNLEIFQPEIVEQLGLGKQVIFGAAPAACNVSNCPSPKYCEGNVCKDAPTSCSTSNCKPPKYCKNGECTGAPLPCTMTITNKTNFSQVMDNVLFSNASFYSDVNFPIGHEVDFKNETTATIYTCLRYNSNGDKICYYGDTLQKCGTYWMVKESGYPYFKLIQ